MVAWQVSHFVVAEPSSSSRQSAWVRLSRHMILTSGHLLNMLDIEPTSACQTSACAFTCFAHKVLIHDSPTSLDSVWAAVANMVGHAYFLMFHCSSICNLELVWLLLSSDISLSEVKIAFIIARKEIM